MLCNLEKFSKSTSGSCPKMLTEENVRPYCIVLLYRIQQFILIFIYFIYKYFHIGGGTTIQSDNIEKSSNKYEGKCTPFKSGILSLCCLQLQNTHSFRSQQNGRIFTIFHQVNCKSDFVIYLLECKKCHIQYLGKAEADFNLRLNNHYKDIYKADAIPASRHFAIKDHIFNRDASLLKLNKSVKVP